MPDQIRDILNSIPTPKPGPPPLGGPTRESAQTKVFVMQEGFEPKPPVTVQLRVVAATPAEALSAFLRLVEDAEAQLTALDEKLRERSAHAQ